MTTPTDLDILSEARRVIAIEVEGMRDLADSLDSNFVSMVEMCMQVLDNGGKIVVSGVGKSGHIGHKIAATLASTGSTAVFMHPVEALHGDIGILQDKDVMIAISYSGETDELLWIIPAAKRLGAKVIALTGGMNSRLAECSDLTVSAKVKQEACPFNLAPTTTTTVTLALGDALAMALLKLRGFTKNDFGRLHPGGAIGRAITLRVRDIMRSGEQHAAVHVSMTVKDALLCMTKARCGSVAVVDDAARLVGIFTDGDFRRHAEEDLEVMFRPVGEVMTPNPTTVPVDALAAEAVKVFGSRKINALPAVNPDGTVAGSVDIQDLPALKLF